ncbi:MAG: hypothetical protein KY455_10810 [Euryarchaeota archaeon]|nr:hypothetical protein [Euryarchaeota archaeon]
MNSYRKKWTSMLTVGISTLAVFAVGLPSIAQESSASCHGTTNHENDGNWYWDTTPQGRDPSSGYYHANWIWIETRDSSCSITKVECWITVDKSVDDEVHIVWTGGATGEGIWNGIPFIVDFGYCESPRAWVRGHTALFALIEGENEGCGCV